MQQRGVLSADTPGAATDAPPTVDVVLLTTDEKLLATLRDASTKHHELWHADSAGSATELLVGGHCGILIADLALLGDAVALFDRLQAQFPELIILATGHRDEEVAVAAAISSGRIYRFLHKPVSPARASLFLGTATRRYGELREVEALALATVRQMANRPRFGKVGIGVALVIVAALGIWWSLWWALDSKPQRSAGTSIRAPVDEYLSRAQEAFKAGDLSNETNDNALAWYRTALNAAPDNEAARAGIERVIAALDKRTVVELRRGDVAAATAALAELQRAHPAHPHLAGLQRQLRALSTPVAPKSTVAPPAQMPRVPAPASLNETPPPAPLANETTLPAPEPTYARTPSPPEPTPQIDRARARLAASQLIAPVDDSAATYLRRAREMGEDETKLKIIATDLAGRILQQARDSLAAGNIERSTSDYDAAAALDAEFELGLPELDAVAQQLSKAAEVQSSASH